MSVEPVEACVILAAGQGRRMGGRNKALLPFRDKSFLETITARCRELGASEIAVVLAEPHAPETARAADELGLSQVRNPAPELGMGSSVAVGFAYALEHFEAQRCLLWPVDLPGVGTPTLRALLNRGGAHAIAIPCYQGRGGHPALVSRGVWSELAACTQEAEGARSVFRREPSRVLRVEVDDPFVRTDFDRPEDLQELH